MCFSQLKILSLFLCHMRKETTTRPVIRRRGREKERGSPVVTWRRRRKASQDGWWSASDPRVAVHGASSRRTVSHQFEPVGCSQSVLDSSVRGASRASIRSGFVPHFYLFVGNCFFDFCFCDDLFTREIFGVTRELSSKCAECLDIECWMKTLVWYNKW